MNRSARSSFQTIASASQIQYQPIRFRSAARYAQSTGTTATTSGWNVSHANHCSAGRSNHTVAGTTAAHGLARRSRARR